MNETILQVNRLSKHFPVRKGFFNKVSGYVRAVNDITFEVRANETVGLVGESGCGKSTTGNCIVRLLDPTSGSILYTARNGDTVNMADASRDAIYPYRKEISMVFQDPYSSLNPRMNVRDIISEPMRMFGRPSKSEIQDGVAGLMARVGLRAEYMTRYPHAFSGGQRQRIGIARAISLNPRLLVCDESVSSLDVSIQAQVLGLLEDLQAEFHMSYLFIAHDLSVVKHISSRVVVMYVGKIVEIADTEDLFENPRHPYTEALLASVPMITNTKSVRKETLKGEVPDPSRPSDGCLFASRCKYVEDECAHVKQTLMPVGDDPFGHRTACIRHREISLKGVAVAQA